MDFCDIWCDASSEVFDVLEKGLSTPKLCKRFCNLNWRLARQLQQRAYGYNRSGL